MTKPPAKLPQQLTVSSARFLNFEKLRNAASSERSNKPVTSKIFRVSPHQSEIKSRLASVSCRQPFSTNLVSLML